MTFFDTSHVDDLPSAKVPPKSMSLGQGFDIGYEQQYRVDSPYSLEYEIMDAWKSNIRELNRTLDKPIDTRVAFNRLGATTDILEDRGAYGDFLEYTETGKLPDDIASGAVRSTRVKRLIEINDQIKEMGNPNVRSLEDIIGQVAKMQQGVEKQSNEVGGIAGTIGQFAGAVAGAFSERDPITLATLPVGGFGRTASMRIATEMGIAGGITAITDAAFVNPNRARAGLEERSVMQEALFAAAGAGIFQGGFEGIAKLLTRGANAASPDIQLDFNDEIMRAAFEGVPESPRARAGLAILDEVEAIESASPYGRTYTGTQRFIGELQEMQEAMGNLPSTAIARALPPVSVDQLERTVDFDIVKERSPDLWAELEQAQARVTELDTERADIQTAIAQPDLIEAARLVDPEAATQLEAIRTALMREDIDEPETAALSMQADVILNRVGKDKIEKASSDAEIPMRYRLKRIGAERKAANAKYREVFKRVEKEREAINRVETLYKATQQKEAVDLLGHALEGRSLGHHMRYEVVEAQQTALARLAETQDDRALAAPHALTSPEGKIDVGLAEPIDETFSFMVNGDGTTMSVREIFDDLLEDEKLDEAMRTCLL